MPHLRVFNFEGRQRVGDCRVWSNVESACIALRQHRQAGALVKNVNVEFTFKFALSAVSDYRGDVEVCRSLCKIKNRIHMHSLDVHFRAYQQIDRSINAAIVRPVTGMSTRQHLGIEIRVRHDHKGVVCAGMQKTRDIEIKCCVPLAQMLSHLPAVYPNGRRMENCLKLDSDCLVFPGLWNLDRAAVPNDAKVVSRVLHGLPGVRNNYLLPTVRMLCRFVPAIGHPCLIRILAKRPNTIQRHTFCVRRRGITWLDSRSGRSIRGRCGQGYAQGQRRSGFQEIAASIHRYVNVHDSLD